MADLSAAPFQDALQHLAAASKATGKLSKTDLSPEARIALLAINTQIVEAQSSSFAAQQAHAAVLDRVRELERQIAEAEDKSAECDRYAPKQMDTGVTVYVLKDEENAAEPPHEACPNCFRDGKIRVLQPTHETKYWGSRETHYRVHLCSSCDSKFEYDGSASRPARVRRNRDDGGSWRL